MTQHYRPHDEELKTLADDQVWVPSDEELVGWQEMFRNAHEQSTPQYIVVVDRIFKVVSTNMTADEFFKLWTGRDPQ